MTATHNILLIATLTALGACGDKDTVASNDSGAEDRLDGFENDETNVTDTGGFDTGLDDADPEPRPFDTGLDDAEPEPDPMEFEDTGVYEKDLSTGCSESSERTSLDDVGTMPTATDLGSAIGPAVATGLLSPESNDWYGLCKTTPSDGPDAAFWWTPPITGAYTMSTFGSSPWTDTILTVLTLGDERILTRVACNDDSRLEDPDDPTGHSADYYHSIIENQAFTAGNQYLIVVESFGQPNIDYQLNIDLVSVSDPEDPGTIDPERGE